MKRPLVSVVSGYTAGLLLAEIFRPPLPALFGAAGAVLVLVFVLEKFRPLLIWALVALVGWTNLACRTAAVSPNDLRILLGDQDAMVTVRGTLMETPRWRVLDRDGQESWRTLAPVRVTEVLRESGRQAAFGQIVATVPGRLDSGFFAGQPVEVTGIIARPPVPLAEGLFNYRDYLATRGFYYQLKTGSTNDWQLAEPRSPGPPATDRFLAWARRTLAFGLPAEDEPLRLLWGMTLGWRTAFTDDVSEPFLRAGTMHMFAIDGLRIALISGMLVALLRGLRVSRAWCGLVTIPLIWFYTAATGGEASAIRASVMMTIVIGGWALKRPGDLTNSLAGAALVILLGDPRQLFEAGFQLSFFVVLIIALLLPPLERVRDRLLRPDPLLPPKLVPRWRRWAGVPLRFLATGFAVSFAAWIGSIPLTARYFHLFSPISPLANLAAVPLGTLALMSNLGSLICGGWFSGATELFNHSAWFFMTAMTQTSELASRIPGAFFYVPAPAWPAIILYYAVLVGVLSGWLFAPPRRLGSAAVLLLIAGIYGWRWERSADETELTVLPLNGGHCVSVDGPGWKNDWLMDCGNPDAVEFTLKPFLRARGVNWIPRLALTHGDSRNIGGATRLNELFGLGEIDTSPVNFRSRVYNATVKTIQDQGTRRRILRPGEVAGDWQVLHPAATDHFPRADDAALVLLGNLHGTRVLLLSDLGRSGQGALLERTNDLRADIVIAGLSEAGEPLGDALLDAVRPKIIVVADSEFPANRRAGSELRARLAERGVPVVYTRTAGAATIVTDAGGWELRTMDGQKFPGRTGPKN